MELWFSENHTDNVQLKIKIDRQLASVKSDFQRIDVFESLEFGRMLTLDGYMMLTEKDEFIYHEMIAHVPMAVNPKIKKILVIGAGDGGVLRELVKYDSIEEIDVSEIDEMVVEVSREYLPFTACGFDDPRVNLYFEDGLKFIRKKSDYYDLIIVDSTDPFGPGEGLFTREFYGNCHNALKCGGILTNQHESPFYKEDARACKRAHRIISDVFSKSYVYQAHIPTYPSGHWLFGFASKGLHPVRDIEEKAWLALDIGTRYYNPALHKGAFALPTYVKELIGDK